MSPAHSVFGSPTPIFINKLGIQSLAVVTPTSKEGNSQNAMPQLVYPTRPRASNACKRKKYRLACQSTHCYLLAIGNLLTIIIFNLNKCYSGNLSSVLSLVHTLDLSIVILYDEWLIELLVCQWEKWEAVIEKVPPKELSQEWTRPYGGPAKPVTGS